VADISIQRGPSLGQATDVASSVIEVVTSPDRSTASILFLDTRSANKSPGGRSVGNAEFPLSQIPLPEIQAPEWGSTLYG